MQQDENEVSHSRGKFVITRRIDLKFWQTCLLNSAGLLMAWAIFPDIQFSNVFTFALLVILIWILNWILRPLLVIFTLPLIIFTMGVGMLFINAFIIYAAARLIPLEGIVVASYWSALGASFFVSVLSWGLAMVKSERIIRRSFKNRSDAEGDENSKDDDVIEV